MTATDDPPELELAGPELAELDTAAEVAPEAVTRAVVVVVPDALGKTPGNTDW